MILNYSIMMSNVMNFRIVKNLSEFMMLQVGYSEMGIMREIGQLTKCSIGRVKAS